MPQQVLHFHDARIINPDVRDELLQAIYKLLQSAVRAPTRFRAASQPHLDSQISIFAAGVTCVIKNCRYSGICMPAARCLVQQVADGACLNCRTGCRCSSRMLQRGKS